ncbi:MAG: choice-of-anchor tandem repeat GloVer-containing protein, partial [Candidatus Cybelea sp.]
NDKDGIDPWVLRRLPMQANRSSSAFIATLAIFTVTLLATSTRAVAQKEKQLYSFNAAGGAYPRAGLILDNAGNLYGTTSGGGAYNEGTVFELMRKTGGRWTERILHNFKGGADGAYPLANLIFDSSGNLYGTTYSGGVHLSGTVFELTPEATAGWTEKLLYAFGSRSEDGMFPNAGLTLDGSGNLYGTTYKGGTGSSGTVFELTPKASSGRTEKVLHSFGQGKDGASPYASLIIDTAGNLYGTTFYGGVDGAGTVFELTPEAGGKWVEKVLHSFNGKDGKNPSASLIFDALGNLYGPTEVSIFELMPKTGGGWTEKLLYNFGSTAGLIFDGAGKLYGTTYVGGTNGYGTLFELTREADGKWKYLVVYSFLGGVDGANPFAGLVLDASGNMYGTTYYGGTEGQGTVFEFTP